MAVGFLREGHMPQGTLWRFCALKGDREWGPGLETQGCRSGSLGDASWSCGFKVEEEDHLWEMVGVRDLWLKCEQTANIPASTAPSCWESRASNSISTLI